PDGNIDFIDRIDNQVKIRGFRIEIGEIENILLQHKDVKEATVIVIEGKDTYICAYIVSEKEINELNLRDYLKQSLPEYMIPSYFVKLDKMPITSNGKLNRRALPKPNLEDRLTSYEAPRNVIEETLVRIWSEVLQTKEVGINDNFFEIGGYSLNAIILSGKIRKELGIEISITHVLKYQTIKEQAQLIEKTRNYEAIVHEENYPVLLNSKRDKSLFCFPPVGGHAATYKPILPFINNYAVYAIDFVNSNVDSYVEQILKIQPEGDFYLLGYSAGGNVAFEVAKELENRGHEIAKLIMVDSIQKGRSSSINEEETKRLETEFIIKNGWMYLPEEIREDMLLKVREYFKFCQQIINSGKINSDINVILSEDTAPHLSDGQYWKYMTMNDIFYYKAKGTHFEVFDERNLKYNVGIIDSIINS
ncbi:thioesterase domain-containing protein, partial [Clostridium frigidicarnis]